VREEKWKENVYVGNDGSKNQHLNDNTQKQFK